MNKSDLSKGKRIIPLIKKYSIEPIKKEAVSNDLDLLQTIQIIKIKPQPAQVLPSSKCSLKSLSNQKNDSNNDILSKTSKLCLLDNSNQSKGLFIPTSLKINTIHKKPKYHTSNNLHIITSSNISSVNNNPYNEFKEKLKNRMSMYKNIVSSIRPIIPDLELHRFVMTPLLKSNMLVCNLKIDNSHSMFNPVIYLTVNNNDRAILIAEKKFHFCQSVFKIYLDNQNKKKFYLGQINSNFFQNEFHFFDSTTNKTFKIKKNFQSTKNELGVLKYQNGCCGSRAFPKIEVELPMRGTNFNYKFNIDKNNINSSIEQDDDKVATTYNLFEAKETTKNIIKLATLTPKWSNKYVTYYMNFTDRVRLSSNKNFILSLNNKNILQFGKMSNNLYSVDFIYPLSPFQAFCISLCQINQQFYW